MRLGIMSDRNNQRTRNFSNEIFEIRKRIRSLDLLGKKKLELFTFDEDPVRLDSDVLDYLTSGVSNMKLYFKSYLRYTKPHLPTISVSKHELLFDGGNLKAARDTISAKISNLKGPSYHFFNKHLKACKTQEDLVSLHKAVQYTSMMQHECDIEVDLVSEESDYED